MNDEVDLGMKNQTSGCAVDRFRHTKLLAIGAVVSVLSLAACSSEPDYCSARGEAQQSLEELRSTNVVEDGTAALEERFQTFSSDIETLVEAAKDEFQTETDALRASLQKSEQVIEGLGQDAAEAAPLVSPAIDDLQASTQDLLDAVDQSC